MLDGTLGGTTVCPLLSNLQAEQALLGAILVNNKAYDRVATFLRPEHFADPINGRIYQTASEFIDAGRVVDAVLLAKHYGDSGILDEVGGPAYMAQLVTAMVGIINAPDYGRAIYELWQRRELIALGTDMVNSASAPAVEAGETDTIIDRTENRLMEIGSASVADDPGATLHAVVTKAVEEGERVKDGKVPAATPTGLPSVDERILGLRPGNLIIVAGRPGMGKAQPLDAPILMADGSWKPMGDLQRGDRLASLDGQDSRVIGIFDQGEKEIHRVAFSDGRSTEVCGDHLWRVSYRDWPAARVLSTTRLMEMLRYKRYQNRLSIDLVDGRFGSNECLPLDPYVLGVLLGDGDLSGTSTPVLTSADPELLEEVTTRLQGRGKLTAHGNTRYCYNLVSGRTSAWIPAALRGLGVTSLQSDEKFIPPAYMRASYQARLDLLRGLMDTDGWCETFGCARFSSGSRKLAEGVRDLVRSLGGLCSIVTKRTQYTYLGEKKDGAVHYTCRIRHAHAEDFFLLERKRRRAARGRNASVRLNLRSIEPVGVKPARCIAVTHPSHLYVTNDYIVTHNTTIANTFALNVALGRRYLRNGDLIESPASGRAVLNFSFETSEEDYGAVCISQLANLSVEQILNGDYDNAGAERILLAKRKIENAPLRTFHKKKSMREIARTARREARKLKVPLGLIVIDYLQLLPDRRGLEKRLSVGANAYDAKALAMDLKVPIVLLSQLSRQVENRVDKRPTMSDLRESGEIEESADVIIMAYREAYYLGQQEPAENPMLTDAENQRLHDEWQQKYNAVAYDIDLLIPKVRRGRAPTLVRPIFRGACSRIEERPQFQQAA